jgi:hypothetical protein
MSEILRIHPADPQHHPDPAQEEAVVDLLRDLFPHAAEIARHAYPRPRYVDAGLALEAVTCSRCARELPVANGDETEAWWLEALGRQGDGGPEAEVALPCCGASQPFRALLTRPATGFAIFEVQVCDPQAPPLIADRLAEVGLTLGSDCRQVVARYEE